MKENFLQRTDIIIACYADDALIIIEKGWINGDTAYLVQRTSMMDLSSILFTRTWDRTRCEDVR